MSTLNILSFVFCVASEVLFCRWFQRRFLCQNITTLLEFLFNGVLAINLWTEIFFYISWPSKLDLSKGNEYLWLIILLNYHENTDIWFNGIKVTFPIFHGHYIHIADFPIYWCPLTYNSFIYVITFKAYFPVFHDQCILIAIKISLKYVNGH